MYSVTRNRSWRSSEHLLWTSYSMHSLQQLQIAIQAPYPITYIHGIQAWHLLHGVEWHLNKPPSSRWQLILLLPCLSSNYDCHVPLTFLWPSWSNLTQMIHYMWLSTLVYQPPFTQLPASVNSLFTTLLALIPSSMSLQLPSLRTSTITASSPQAFICPKPRLGDPKTCHGQLNMAGRIWRLLLKDTSHSSIRPTICLLLQGQTQALDQVQSHQGWSNGQQRLLA